MALGRKSWLFCGSGRGEQRAAVLYSLIASGVIWVYDANDDDGILAFSDEGIEEVKLLLGEYHRVYPSKA